MLNFFKKKLPKVSIKYGKLLDPVFIFYCKNSPDLKKIGWNDWTPPSPEQLTQRIDAYRTEWRKWEKIILETITSTLKLNFKRNVIDVYIVSGNPRQLSNPLVIKSTFKPDEFVDTLAHELIHRLFDDNSREIPGTFIEQMFPGETSTTRNHIITHALLMKLYREIFKDESRLERNLRNSNKHSTNDYSRAWEIVNKEGHQEIIKRFLEQKKRASR